MYERYHGKQMHCHSLLSCLLYVAVLLAVHNAERYEIFSGR